MPFLSNLPVARSRRKRARSSHDANVHCLRVSKLPYRGTTKFFTHLLKSCFQTAVRSGLAGPPGRHRSVSSKKVGSSPPVAFLGRPQLTQFPTSARHRERCSLPFLWRHATLGRGSQSQRNSVSFHSAMPNTTQAAKKLTSLFPSPRQRRP
jgi:hypothetical protein